MTGDTVIKSPRYIADGRGAWQGTLAELLDMVVRYEPARARDVLYDMVSHGPVPAEWLTGDELAGETLDLDDARIIPLIERRHIVMLLDDPNVEIYN